MNRPLGPGMPGNHPGSYLSHYEPQAFERPAPARPSFDYFPGSNRPPRPVNAWKSSPLEGPVLANTNNKPVSYLIFCVG